MTADLAGRGLARTASWVTEQSRLFGSAYMCEEAPAFTERTSVGLDVNARSVVAAAIDGVAGEVFRARLTPGNDDVIGWVRSLPGPSAAVYEAGPTGFGMSCAFTTAGIRCEVVAPSKIQRPAGDRANSDARDAMRLAKLLGLDEVVSVTVPSVEREAARDLVRAREDVLGDLMRARHRVSKLLLRQGIVYYGSRAWTGIHLVWLRKQHFDAPGLQLAFDAEHEAVLQAGPPGPPRQGDRGDGRGQRVHPGRTPPGVPARGLDADLVRVGSRGRGLGPANRGQHRGVPGVGAHRVLLGTVPLPRLDHQDRQHPRPPAAG